MSTPKSRDSGAGRGKLTGRRIPRKLRDGQRPRLDHLRPRGGVLAARRQGRVLRWRLEHDALERGEPVLVQADQAVEVHGAHLGRERVCDLRGVVQEQVSGDDDRGVLEAVPAGHGVRVDGGVQRVQEEQVVEWLAGEGVQARVDAVLD